MKILQVMGAFVPARFGGTQKFCHGLSRELVKRGHQVTVYASDADIGRERIPNILGTRYVDGIRVHYFRNLSAYLTYKLAVYLPLGLPWTARREVRDYDVIHLQVFRSMQNIVVHHYARKHRVPYILQPHGSIPQKVQGKRGFKWLLKWLYDALWGKNILRDACRVLADTQVGFDEAVAAGKEADKIVMIPLPFDTAEFSPLPPRGRFREKYGIKQKHIVMFLGRIYWIKGLDFLVESFYKLTQTRDDVMLAMVGPDQDYQATLEEMIERFGIADKVLFTGFLDGQDKLAALVDADVVCQLSRYEQAAWAPLEAVLCGTPIIVSKNTGSGEDVARLDAGDLVEYGDQAGLVAAIANILDNPAAARARTQKARDYIIANISLTSLAGEYERIYEACIVENSATRRGK